MPVMLGWGAVTAVIMATYDYTAGGLKGFKKINEVDEFERKETLRRNRRRPIEETIADVGEGRCELLQLPRKKKTINKIKTTDMFQQSAHPATRSGDVRD